MTTYLCCRHCQGSEHLASEVLNKHRFPCPEKGCKGAVKNPSEPDEASS